MIQYTNIQLHTNIDFTDYLKFDGYSHSFLKYEMNGDKTPVEVTDSMRIGSFVDCILTGESKGVDMLNPLYSVAKNIAIEINNSFGELIKTFKTQLSYTAEMHYMNHSFKTTGRLDYLLPGHAVIDLKVTNSKNVLDLINWMGYKNQVWHYSKMAGVSKAYIMIFSRPLNKTFLIPIDVSNPSNEFFEGKILKLGTVKKQLC